MTQEEPLVYAQALLAEAELLAATLPALRQQQAEAQAALERVRARGTREQIMALVQALKRLERLSSLRLQTVQRLRQEGERVLTALRAEEQPSQQESQV